MQSILFCSVLKIVGLLFVLGVGWGAASQIPQTGCEAPTWGFFGHRMINRHAVFSLPPEMMGFFKKNIDFLTEHAIDADKRRYASPHEAVRHYIDLDVYGKPPFDNLPRNWTDALLRYSDIYFVTAKGDTLELLQRDSLDNHVGADSLFAFHPALSTDTVWALPRREVRRFFIHSFLPQYYEENWTAPCDSLAHLLGAETGQLDCRRLFAIDRLSEHGILPWHLQHMLRRLTEAFRVHDADKIRRFSADIGHYIADAHVPLHTTENYNGQLTNQLGIHAFWESRLPELFADERYEFWVGPAQLIEDPETFFWEIVLESHALVDSVLLIEQDLRENFPADRQLCNEMRNNKLVLTQCEEFAAAYDDRMSGMVERRMKESMLAVSSAWYTAWVLAGQPDLSFLYIPAIATDSTEIELEKAVQNGQQKGREHDK